MSLFKLLPIAAIAAVGVLGSKALKKSADTVTQVGAAATYQVEMDGIAKAVAMEFTENERLPLDNFPEFLRQNMREARGSGKRDPSKDPWGTEYRLAKVSGGFEVRSAGPDTQWETADDLAKPQELRGLGQVSSEPALRTAGQPAKDAAQSAAAMEEARKQREEKARLAKIETDKRVVDYQKARAADGSVTSQYDLGMRYFEGNGVEKDLEQAKVWLQKAATAGHSQAKDRLHLEGWESSAK